MKKQPQKPQKVSKRIINYVCLSIFALSLSGFLVWYFYKVDSPERPEQLPKPLKSGGLRILDTVKHDFAFSNNTFDTGEELSLLNEIGLCDTSKTENEYGACSPKFFKFFPLSGNKPLGEGFILIVNGRLYPDNNTRFSIRRTFVYERIGGKLKLVNQFKGNLIEQRRVEGLDHDHLIIRFRLDQYDEAYHVLYTWNNNRYKFQRCEELFSPLNKGKVRKEMIDSVSREVEKIIQVEKLVG